MNIRANAVYKNGVLKPTNPLPLAEDQQVALTIADPAAAEAIASTEEFFRLADEFAFDNDAPRLPRDFSTADVYLDHD